MKHLATPLLFAAMLALVGCGQEQTDTPDAPPSQGENQPTVSLPDGFFLSEAPDGALPLSAARAAAGAGEPVAFTGYIGGRTEPFTEGRAIFLVADVEKAPPCADGCPRPWDACCVPGDVVIANSATVQIVDADGQTLRLGVKGRQGLVPGAMITVVGTVRQVSDAVFIVDATGVAVQEG